VPELPALAQLLQLGIASCIGCTTVMPSNFGMQPTALRAAVDTKR